MTDPLPVTMLTTPDGRPASSMNSTTFAAVTAVSCAGLNTTVFPNTSERIENPRLNEYQKIVLPPEIVIRQSSLRLVQ
jgi:hypothetical protein